MSTSWNRNAATGTRLLSSIDSLRTTPSVALRCLYEEMQRFKALSVDQPRDLFRAFHGEIAPPRPHLHRPIGDSVVDAVAEYATKVVARAGMLTAIHYSDEQVHLERHGRLLREVFAIEHSLGVALARLDPGLGLRRCDAAGRAVLAVAAFWFDRDQLLDLDHVDAHTLLGVRPTDSIGGVLFDHAVTAWSAMNSTPIASPPKNGGKTNVVELELELNLASAG